MEEEEKIRHRSRAGFQYSPRAGEEEKEEEEKEEDEEEQDEEEKEEEEEQDEEDEEEEEEGRWRRRRRRRRMNRRRRICKGSRVLVLNTPPLPDPARRCCAQVSRTYRSATPAVLPQQRSPTACRALCARA